MLKQIDSFIKDNRYILIIAIIAFILRIVRIETVPPSLNWDEVSHGYNAYSILKTGKDEWGFTLPSIFRAYGDYKLPVYIYLSAVSEFFFGLNAFAVRIPSVLAGVGTTIVTYFLVKELFKNHSQHGNHNLLPAISALLVAVEPWSLFLSRGAFEANLALFFFVTGTFFFLKTFSRSRFYILLSTFFLGLTVWTYNSYRVFTPLMILVLFVIYRKNLLSIFQVNKKLAAYCILFTALIFIPMFYQLLNPIGRARYGNVSIVDEGLVNQINEARTGGCPRIQCNKVTFFCLKFISNYLSHFSPEFLFFKGGSHYQFSTPGHGLIYVFNSMFMVIGILFLLRYRSKVTFAIIAWIVLAPIPSSLTREAPHVLRFITILPLPMILTGLGFIWVLNQLKLKYQAVATVVYFITLFLFTENYLVGYFGNYSKNYSWSWQYGYKEAADYIKNNYAKYDKIIFTKKYGEPHEFILFYGAAAGNAPWLWSPESFQNDPNLNRFYQSNWWWVDGFDKFYFVNDWEIPKSGNQFVLESKKTVDCTTDNCLLITGSENYPEGWKKLETIKFLDGKPAFEVLEN